MNDVPWVAALLAGGAAQSIKLLLAVSRARAITLRTLLNLPGMPSTWAAMCGALVTAVAKQDGFASAAAAMTATLSCLVLYDALKLRRSAGRQAQLLNLVARDLELHRPEAAGRHLRELLGETPAQVVGGAVIGILVALP